MQGGALIARPVREPSESSVGPISGRVNAFCYHISAFGNTMASTTNASCLLTVHWVDAEQRNRCHGSLTSPHENVKQLVL